MTFPTIYLAVALTGMWVFVCLTAFVWTPRVLRSLFRYKMWKLRDEVYDDISSKQLPDNYITSQFLSGIETVITASADLTLANWTAFPKAPSREAGERRQQLEHSRKQMSSEQRAKLDGYQRQFHGIFTRHLIFGSISGWFAFSVCLPMILVVELWKGIRRGAVIPYLQLRSAISRISENKIGKIDRVWMPLHGEGGIWISPPPMCWR